MHPLYAPGRYTEHNLFVPDLHQHEPLTLTERQRVDKADLTTGATRPGTRPAHQVEGTENESDQERKRTEGAPQSLVQLQQFADGQA